MDIWAAFSFGLSASIDFISHKQNEETYNGSPIRELLMNRMNTTRDSAKTSEARFRTLASCL